MVPPVAYRALIWVLLVGAVSACSRDTVLGESARGDAAAHAPDGAAGAAERAGGSAALYLFDDTDRGRERVSDRSGRTPALDLALIAPESTQWTDTGLRFTGPALLGQPAGADASRIVQACRSVNEVTLEAWATPAVLEQPESGDMSPRRIAAISLDTVEQNLQLGQLRDRYRGRVLTDCEGCREPDFLLFTPDDSVRLRKTHLALVREAAGQLRLYVDGVEVANRELAGTFDAWQSSFRLSIGNEQTLDRHWLGEVHLIAVYCRALSAAEVAGNFAAGDGH
jgi:hypothetical protein